MFWNKFPPPPPPPSKKESFFNGDDMKCETLYLFSNRANVVM